MLNDSKNEEPSITFFAWYVGMTFFLSFFSSSLTRFSTALINL